MKRLSTMLSSAFFCLWIPTVYGQANPGARITSAGLTGVVFQDEWSLQSNQAGLGKVSRPVLSAAFETKYFNPDLTVQSLVFAYPSGRNVFGISFQNYGFSAYSEQKVGFAYAKRFGNSIFTALNFNYYQLKIDQYGSSGTYSFEGGLQYQVNDKLLIGAHIANPTRNEFGNDLGAEIPVKAEFGLSYRFSEKVVINSAVVKTLTSTADTRLGLIYEIADWFALRGGYSLNPMRHYAGFGTVFRKFRLDAATSSHQALGYSPQVSLSYEF